MPHPQVDQLRFTRSEFMRGLEGLASEDATRRMLPANSISWNVGHLAWQEQRYFLKYAGGAVPYPDVDTAFAFRAPASTPPLGEVLEKWRAITAAADPWLDGVTDERLLEVAVSDRGRPITSFGNLLQRVIYHYWFHTGENAGLRQAMGHTDLPQFVGDIDGLAPFRV